MLLSALAAESEDRGALPDDKSSAVDKPRDRALFPVLAILMLMNLLEKDPPVKWSVRNRNMFDHRRALAAALVNAQAADKSSADNKCKDWRTHIMGFNP